MVLEKRLCRLRQEKGVSQAELAHTLGVTRQTVSRWECGTSVPSTENLAALCQFYGVDFNTLMDDSAELPPQEVDPEGRCMFNMENKFYVSRAVCYTLILALGNFLLIYLLNWGMLSTPVLKHKYCEILLVGSSILIGCAVFPIVRKLLHVIKGPAKNYVLFTIPLYALFVVIGYFSLQHIESHPLLPQLLPTGSMLPGLIVQSALLLLTKPRKNKYSPIT